jgi:ferredoxin
MPKKYHIETRPTPTHHRVPGRASLIDWEEGCLKCAVCVKKKCVYGVYRNREIDLFSLADTADMLCKHCFQCVQSCPNRLISKSVNPEYGLMGNDYWTPDIITKIYYQAEQGKIPVSGAGYPGPFSGPGFDSMWTDMSEIVRPTRDGIHGREYISTLTTLGSSPSFLEFDRDGELIEPETAYIELPLPLVLSQPEGFRVNEELRAGLNAAARELDSLFLLPVEEMDTAAEENRGHLMPRFSRGSLWPDQKAYQPYKIIEIDDWPGLERWLTVFRKSNPKMVVSVRLPFSPGFMDRVDPLVEAGAGVLHFTADSRGRQPGFEGDPEKAPTLVDLIRQVHMHFVGLNMRDRVTLMISGGIALAEHVAKAIACGVDALVVDMALWTALECRVCSDCLSLDSCPVEIEYQPKGWIKQRLVNLVGAWQNQLLEVLGAMGIREIRRLRGEVGRAMFFEQLEEESFGPIFGKRKSGS